MAVADEIEGTAFATCNKCSYGVVLMVKTPVLPERIVLKDDLDDPDDVMLNVLSSMRVIAMAPAARAPRAIMHVPAQVERAYREGEVNRAEKRYLSAAGNYRTALDRALKNIAPNESGTLYQKVEKLAARNALPEALIGLMHEIRFLGNQIHDDDDPEPQDVEAGADFTTLLLTYLYELPGRVRAAAAKREAGKQAG